MNKNKNTEGLTAEQIDAFRKFPMWIRRSEREFDGKDDLWESIVNYLDVSDGGLFAVNATGHEMYYRTTGQLLSLDTERERVLAEIDAAAERLGTFSYSNPDAAHHQTMVYGDRVVSGQRDGAHPFLYGGESLTDCLFATQDGGQKDG